MRQIKFRAWDKHGERMGEVIEIDWAFEHLRVRFNTNDFKFPLGDFDLLQFTGLKDKNGREIYEGDILRNTWSSSEQIGAVVILPRGIQLQHTDGVTFQTFTTDIWFDKELEVIGNIYENPELHKV